MATESIDDNFIRDAAERFARRGHGLYRGINQPQWFALESGDGDFAGWLEGKAEVLAELERVEANEPEVGPGLAEAIADLSDDEIEALRDHAALLKRARGGRGA